MGERDRESDNNCDHNRDRCRDGEHGRDNGSEHDKSSMSSSEIDPLFITRSIVADSLGDRQ